MLLSFTFFDHLQNQTLQLISIPSPPLLYLTDWGIMPHMGRAAVPGKSSNCRETLCKFVIIGSRKKSSYSFRIYLFWVSKISVVIFLLWIYPSMCLCVCMCQSLDFTKIAHSITAQDHQPTPDSCILSMVVGQLKVSRTHDRTNSSFLFKITARWRSCQPLLQYDHDMSVTYMCFKSLTFTI